MANVVRLYLIVSLVSVAVVQAQPASDPGEEKALAFRWIDDQADTLRRVNRNIWGYAETGLEEFRSAKELVDLLEANDFTVEQGVAGMPTAFVASYGSGRPVIGILAEYDALPGLSQEAVSERSARPGVDAGHGCGHSVFGTGSTAAAIGIKQRSRQVASLALCASMAPRPRRRASARSTCCAMATSKTTT